MNGLNYYRNIRYHLVVSRFIEACFKPKLVFDTTNHAVARNILRSFDFILHIRLPLSVEVD